MFLQTHWQQKENLILYWMWEFKIMIKNEKKAEALTLPELYWPVRPVVIRVPSSLSWKTEMESRMKPP